MSEQDTRVAAEPLNIVARKIKEHAKKSDEHMIAAAMLVREARRRIEAGEAGMITWYEWGLKYIKLSTSRLYELQSIAEADNPEAELERLRRQTRERVKQHRKKKAEAGRQSEQERRKLIAWAKKAPLDEVRRVLGIIGKQRSAALPIPIDGRLGRDQLEAA